jgi:DNA mismatch repair ATPase MutS
LEVLRRHRRCYWQRTIKRGTVPCTCRIFHSSKIPSSVCLQGFYQICRAQSIFFEPGSMHIRLKHNEKALFLDTSTIAAMELIRSAKETSPSQKKSLLSIVDKARTRAVKRFFRRNLLEPPGSEDNHDATRSSRGTFVE